MKRSVVAAGFQFSGTRCVCLPSYNVGFGGLEIEPVDEVQIGRLVSIQVGTPREHVAIGGTAERAWTTAFWKSPVAGPVAVRRTNLDGDGQADLVNHGGPDKAVCVYTLDHYTYWRDVFAEAGIALDAIEPGAFGENFSVEGLDESTVCIGDVWRIGDAMFQVSQPRQPCWKLARRWGIKTLAAQVIENGKTGWYLRVLEEGTIAAGMEILRVERPCPEWTVERANWVMHKAKSNRDAARELSLVASLSESWREELQKRFSKS
jgi:MOSC domain-containing protein YiiM